MKFDISTDMKQYKYIGRFFAYLEKQIQEFGPLLHVTHTHTHTHTKFCSKFVEAILICDRTKFLGIVNLIENVWHSLHIKDQAVPVLN
jgi:hypothetical protein